MSNFSYVLAYLMVLRDIRSLNKKDISSDCDGMKIRQSLSHLGELHGGLQILE